MNNFTSNVRRLLFCGLFLITSTIRPNLSIQEQQEILQTCLVPQELKQELDHFFANDDVQEYMAIPKNFVFPWGNKRLTEASLVQKGEYQNWVAQQEIHRTHLLTQICQKYGLTCYEGSAIGDSSTIISCPNRCDCILKILNVYYPMYPEIYQAYKLGKEGPRADQDLREIISIKTKYQNVSRVLMAQKIAQFVQLNNLNLITVPRKFFYPLPNAQVSRDLSINGINYPEINDDNYIVIAQKIPNLPTESLNKEIVAHMINKNAEEYKNFIKLEYCDLLEQLVQVITYAGIWCVGPNNIFAIDNHFALIDLEKPGLGGSEERHFFHKNQKEIIDNGIAGINALIDWLNK